MFQDYRRKTRLENCFSLTRKITQISKNITIFENEKRNKTVARMEQITLRCPCSNISKGKWSTLQRINEVKKLKSGLLVTEIEIQGLMPILVVNNRLNQNRNHSATFCLNPKLTLL